MVIKSKATKPAPIVVTGFVTEHEKQNGFVHLRLELKDGEQERCADDSLIEPFDTFLPEGTKVEIIMEGDVVTKIRSKPPK